MPEHGPFLCAVLLLLHLLATASAQTAVVTKTTDALNTAAVVQTLTWSGFTGTITSYTVLRHTSVANSGGTVVISGLPSTAGSYNITGVDPGTSTHWIVRAIRTSGSQSAGLTIDNVVGGGVIDQTTYMDTGVRQVDWSACTYTGVSLTSYNLYFGTSATAISGSALATVASGGVLSLNPVPTASLAGKTHYILTCTFANGVQSTSSVPIDTSPTLSQGIDVFAAQGIVTAMLTFGTFNTLFANPSFSVQRMPGSITLTTWTSTTTTSYALDAVNISNTAVSTHWHLVASFTGGQARRVLPIADFYGAQNTITFVDDGSAQCLQYSHLSFFLFPFLFSSLTCIGHPASWGTATTG